MKLKELSKKKLIFIFLAVLICLFVLLGVIYQQTALWKPTQSLITLLPESPICYLTFKDLEGTIKTFNQSEFGKQVAQMPILDYIKKQLWWKHLVFQKEVWEFEMGGRLDMGAFNGHFGKEVILALYQSEGEVSFLLITELGGKEKLAIEAITATDAINRRYKRIQTEYNEYTINTITGYPLDFSYTFIGKIGMLSLNPLLLADVIDIYVDKKDNFLSNHSKKQAIQNGYERNNSTGYLDITHFVKMLKSLEFEMGEVIGQVSSSTDKPDYLTFGNRYEDGTIISHIEIGDTGKSMLSKLDKQHTHKFLPEKTAFTAYNSHQDLDRLWNTLNEHLLIEIEPASDGFSKHLKPEMTIELISLQKDKFLKLPSLVIHLPIKNKTAFIDAINEHKRNKIVVAGKPIKFLEQQVYNGITIQPLRLPLNPIMSLSGAYTFVDNDFFFSTTLAGLKSVLDTKTVASSMLAEVTFSKSEGVIQTFIQPDILIPEIRKYLSTISLLVSLSGQKIDFKLTHHISQNLFPLESLGPIAIDVYNDESGIDTEIRIVLEK